MNVIQCGLGGMGRQWLKTVNESSNVHFAAYVEIDPATATARIAEFDLDPALVFSSLEAALAAVLADGVIDVTPPAAHKSIGFTAMDAGVPVLAEKPLAPTRADAQALVDKSTDTGVLYMVAQNYRYSPVMQTLKQVLTAGDMGAVGAVNVRFFKGPHFGGFREIMAYPLIVDMAIHHFDLMRFLLGSNPVEIYGKSWNPPWSWFQGDASAAVSAHFANGVAAQYAGSWCAQGQETAWNGEWRFDCAEGVVTVVDDHVFIQRAKGVEERPGYRHVGTTETLEVPFVPMERQAQAYLLHEFYEAVTQGKPAATICQDNLYTVNFVFDVVQSFETGAVVRPSAR